jgi:hypothetical protein
VSLPQLGDVHFHQLTRITFILGKAQGAGSRSTHRPYVVRRLRLEGQYGRLQCAQE